ncbi:MAG: 50S ribosomal protein L10 [Anaerolineae bacterium]
MALTKERKNELVAQYVELLDRTNGFIIVQHKGMTVKETEALRGKIREANGKYAITKNTLLVKALEERGWPVPDDLLKGPTAVAFGLDNLPGVAKAVLDYTKTLAEKVSVSGGVMTGQIIAADKVEAVSNLPTLDEIRAQLAGLIVAPATGLVTVLNAANSQIVNVIQAYLDDREKGSGDAA